ncbi:inactive peptidyl-prolyl cis-trans isomerase FKBP6 [Diaphorina citri]|uniref:peptidylprolyl isomerase n=1 Tax=Diaphorina citri TaxID=121845 RepID=A0A1S3D3Y7_DIACI|nr:inactive peptidyl-prolyl cis-trans isomerase FKBP6 [Diaphorina citri]XP_026680661.1 inactive peptidyl-prolyl cis-trans isomerase FKBP6 [Diaphorina citri]KAI5744091.1 hypothetical protein M8J77_025580 [Diaphorina citri]
MQCESENPIMEMKAHSRKLAKPIDLEALSKDGCELVFNKTDEEFEDTYDAEHDYDNYDALLKFANLDLLNNPLSKDMVPVPYGKEQIQDGKLMKKIKEKGFGENPVLGAHVQVHYMYYAEANELPIDITYLRKSIPERFQLGSSGLIPAFEYAILSMQKGEKSDFFASYELCFGALGCPPRIPAKADLLFEVHLINFSIDPQVVRSSADIESDFIDSQVEEPAFAKVLKRAQELGASGKNAFNDKNIVSAVRRYRDAVKLLINTQVTNYEDQMQLEEYLCRVYRNLMVCYNNNKQYKLTCDCASKALQFASHFATKDVKLFFVWGKALIGLQEWTSAIKHLKTARKLAAKDSVRAEIDKEILKADLGNQQYQKETKARCMKMFSSSSSPSQHSNVVRIAYQEHEQVRPATLQEIQDTEESNESDGYDVGDFEKLMEIRMSEFRMAEGIYEDVFGETAEFSRRDIDIIKSIANKMGLTCTVDKNIIVTKTI